MILPRSVLVALTLTGATLALPAAGQTPPISATSEDADPLTPKAVDAPPPQAPGAPALTAKLDDKAPQHSAVAALLARLAQPAHVKKAAAEDREAIAAYYAENGGQLLWTTPQGPSARAKAALEELQRAVDYGLSGNEVYAIAAPADFGSPDAQADHELAVGLALLTYARHARGGRTDPGNISRMIDMRPRLFEAKSVLAALAAAADPAAAMRLFHPQHDGFKRLQKALVEARAGNAKPDAVQRIEVNLERWRWMPDDLGAFHVRNNLPEQLTRVYKDGQVVLTEKIVIGKPSSPTPVMTANMQFVIFHPSWGVPSGIKTNEVAPMLQRASKRNQEFFGSGDNASRALGRHQLRVSLNGRELNPDSVDWTRVDIRQFHFSQPPSSQNVLGVVKFRFPNKHDVYMHDTTERHLFSAGTRTFSHGCMRVQNPIHLAEVILGHDKGWSADKVRAFVPGGRSSDVTLSNEVPVHLTYFTTTVDDAGVLHTHGDVYGMDQRVASALAGKPVALASAKVVEAGGTARAAPKRERMARAGRQVVEKSWNPFKDW